MGLSMFDVLQFIVLLSLLMVQLFHFWDKMEANSSCLVNPFDMAPVIFNNLLIFKIEVSG